MQIIPKMQQGGGFDSLFTSYTPVEAPKASSEASSEKESKSKSNKDSLSEKDLFDILEKVDGLPNDTRTLVNLIYKRYQYSALSAGVDSDSLSKLLFQSIYQLKTANFSKKEYDNVYKLAETGHYLNEIAISLSGKVFALTKNDETVELTIEQYISNKDKLGLKPLTNSNLLYLRAWDNKYIGNDNIFLVVNNGIGMELLDKMIRAKMGSLGTDSETKSEYVALTGDKTYSGEAALQAISYANQNKGLSLGELYKLKGINSTQIKQAKAAVDYIYDTLPENAKTLLKLKSGLVSNDPNKLKELAKDLIFKHIQSQMTQSTTYDISYEGELGKVKGSSSKSSGSGNDDDDSGKNTKSFEWLNGLGYRENFLLNTGVEGGYLSKSIAGVLTDNNGKELGLMSSLKDVSSGEYGGILDWNNMTIGGNIVNPALANEILLRDNNIYSIDLPYTTDAKGRIIPNFELANLKALADKTLKTQGIDMEKPESIKLNYNRINAYYASLKIPIRYNSEGLPNYEFKRFAVIHVYATEKSIGGLLSSTFGTPVRDNYTIDSVSSTIKHNSGNDEAKVDAIDKWSERVGLLNGHNELYETQILIPVKVDYNNALTGIKQTSERALLLDQQSLRNRLYSLYVKMSSV